MNLQIFYFIPCDFLQAPLILNTCTTSSISSYEIRIVYSNNDGRSTETGIVPGNVTSVMMSDYFPGHPLPDTTYNITVIAVNEGGRGIAKAPICKYPCRSKLTY